MIKLKDLISEKSSSRAKIINSKAALNKLLTTTFSEAYKLDKISKVGLYRSVRNHVGDIAYLDPSKTERFSRDTNNFYTALLSIVPSWKNYPKRSFSVIALLSDDPLRAKNITNQYGGWMYQVIPKNGARFAVSNNKDAFGSFKNIFTRLGMDIDDLSMKIPRYLTTVLNHKDKYKTFDYNYNNILEVIKYWDDNITKEMVLADDLGYHMNATYFKEDIEKNFNGSWLDYFDGLLDPVKNGIQLMSIEGIYSLTNTTVEVWTDAPCLLVIDK